MSQNDAMGLDDLGEPDERAELQGHLVNLFHDARPDSWLAVVDDLPGIMAQAPTKAEVLANLRENLSYATAS